MKVWNLNKTCVNMSCPNKNTAEWKYLSYALGEDKAMEVFHKNGNQLPTLEEIITKYPRQLGESNNIKDGISFVYEQNQELSKITRSLTQIKNEIEIAENSNTNNKNRIADLKLKLNSILKLK